MRLRTLSAAGASVAVTAAAITVAVLGTAPAQAATNVDFRGFSWPGVRINET